MSAAFSQLPIFTGNPFMINLAVSLSRFTQGKTNNLGDDVRTGSFLVWSHYLHKAN